MINIMGRIPYDTSYIAHVIVDSHYSIPNAQPQPSVIMISLMALTNQKMNIREWKSSSIQFAYRKCGTHVWALSPCLAHADSSNEIKQRYRGRRPAGTSEYQNTESGHKRKKSYVLPWSLLPEAVCE